MRGAHAPRIVASTRIVPAAPIGATVTGHNWCGQGLTHGVLATIE